MSKRHPDLFLLQINLAGFHNRVYHMRWNRELESYWDKSGNISYDPQQSPIKRFGILQIVFKTQKEAEAARRGGCMVCEFFLEMFKESVKRL